MAHVRASLAGVPVSRAMIRNVVTVAADEPMVNVARQMLAGFQDDVPVVDGEALVGIVGRAEVLRGAVEGDANVPVSSVMARTVPSVSETDALDSALERLQESGRRSIPVLRGGVLVGMLPIENVAYLLQVRERTRAAVAHGRL